MINQDSAIRPNGLELQSCFEIKRLGMAFWAMISGSCLLASFVMMVGSVRAANTNPFPQINQPLVPDATSPGGPAFHLTVNGTGFVPGSVVQWNGSTRTTNFISQGQLIAIIGVGHPGGEDGFDHCG